MQTYDRIITIDLQRRITMSRLHAGLMRREYAFQVDHKLHLTDITVTYVHWKLRTAGTVRPNNTTYNIQVQVSCPLSSTHYQSQQHLQHDLKQALNPTTNVKLISQSTCLATDQDTLTTPRRPATTSSTVLHKAMRFVSPPNQHSWTYC